MKRNMVIAAVTAAALLGGGTATALAVTDDGRGPDDRTPARTAADDSVDRVRHGDDTQPDDRTRSDRSTGSDDRARTDDRTRADDRPHTDDRADDHNSARLRSARVTAAGALAAALRHTPGTAVSAHLDDDHATPDWEVEILGSGGAWYEVHVDAGTGKIVSSRTETGHRGGHDD